MVHSETRQILMTQINIVPHIYISGRGHVASASKSSIRRFVITEKAPTSTTLNSVLNVKAVVAAFNQEKALVGAFSVIMNLRMELF